MTLTVFPSTITGKYIGLSMMDLWEKRHKPISAIPDDRGVGGMTVSPDFQVVERRRQNDKACKVLFLKYTHVTYQCCRNHYTINHIYFQRFVMSKKFWSKKLKIKVSHPRLKILIMRSHDIRYAKTITKKKHN
ncbi:hypothetical protein U3516DRAFT_760820 [Neocallimastix sp. 'constans']